MEPSLNSHRSEGTVDLAPERLIKVPMSRANRRHFVNWLCCRRFIRDTRIRKQPLEAIMTRMVQATVKLAARTNTAPRGSVELHTIAAVHQSLVDPEAAHLGPAATRCVDSPFLPDSVTRASWRTEVDAKGGSVELQAIAAVQESAFGTKRTRSRRLAMSVHWGEAEVALEASTLPSLTLNGRWVAACAAGYWPFSPPARHKVLCFRN
jgi:hypothetical protein